MADTDVGKHGTFHSEDGPKDCKVVHYQAGRDSGDHVIETVFGGDRHTGDVRRIWSVVGEETGAFEVG